MKKKKNFFNKNYRVDGWLDSLLEANKTTSSSSIFRLSS
jgi:hypothetical protein